MSIDRGSTKHGPRLDEEMAHEVKGEDLPEPGWIPPGHLGSETGDDRDPDRRDERAWIGAYLPRDIFPADRLKLVAAARAQQAPDEVIEVLGRLAADVTYPGAPELWKALGLHSDR